MPRRSFEQQVAHSDLNYWGFWKGLQLAADGASPINTLAQIMSGRCENPGHRVLCLDMKPRAWQINARVFSLPGDLIAALVARYCLPCKPDGHPYRPYELAPLLGVSPRVYRDRLERGRIKYREMIYGGFRSHENVLNS